VLSSVLVRGRADAKGWVVDEEPKTLVEVVDLIIVADINPIRIKVEDNKVMIKPFIGGGIF